MVKMPDLLLQNANARRHQRCTIKSECKAGSTAQQLAAFIGVNKPARWPYCLCFAVGFYYTFIRRGYLTKSSPTSQPSSRVPCFPPKETTPFSGANESRRRLKFVSTKQQIVFQRKTTMTSGYCRKSFSTVTLHLKKSKKKRRCFFLLTTS